MARNDAVESSESGDRADGDAMSERADAWLCEYTSAYWKTREKQDHDWSPFRQENGVTRSCTSGRFLNEVIQDVRERQRLDKEDDPTAPWAYRLRHIWTKQIVMV